ncbi:MAG: VOC family protein [Actinomycetota bacterium]|nr:VOC family protein [Actinomycetota bacterium]
MPRVVHFELPAEDPRRAASFYEEVFGWTTSGWGGPADYLLVSTGSDAEPGINGAILRRAAPVEATTNIVSVESVDDYTQRVTRAGGELVREKTAIPSVGYIAYCRDPEGNVFGIFQSDESVDLPER